MKINLDAPSEDIRIEIIPLIDVIFCILTFFILAALQVTRQQAINVDLPKTSKDAASQMREILIVTLQDQDRVYIEQQQITSPEQFTLAVKNYHAANPNGSIVLRASRTLSYDVVMQALDLMKKAGGDRVALATEPASPSEQAPGSNTAVPPVPATPGVTPYPGNAPVDPYNPYGTPYPATPYNPAQPQLPLNPGQQLPGQPGVYPTNPGNVPGQPGVYPINPELPTPAVPDSGSTNARQKRGSTRKR